MVLIKLHQLLNTSQGQAYCLFGLNLSEEYRHEHKLEGLTPWDTCTHSYGMVDIISHLCSLKVNPCSFSGSI